MVVMSGCVLLVVTNEQGSI